MINGKSKFSTEIWRLSESRCWWWMKVVSSRQMELSIGKRQHSLWWYQTRRRKNGKRKTIQNFRKPVKTCHVFLNSEFSQHDNIWAYHVSIRWVKLTEAVNGRMHLVTETGQNVRHIQLTADHVLVLTTQPSTQHTFKTSTYPYVEKNCSVLLLLYTACIFLMIYGH